MGGWPSKRQFQLLEEARNFRSAADHGSSLESKQQPAPLRISDPGTRQFQRTVMFQRGRAESEAPRRWRHHRGTRIGPTRSVPEM